MRIRDRVAFGSSLWLRFARCVARSVIVVTGKFASILICGLAAELRNSQPQSVLRFCVFGGQGFFGLTKKSQKPSVTGRFVATNHRGPVPKVTEPAPFCDLICKEVRRFEFRVSDQDFASFFLVVLLLFS